MLAASTFVVPARDCFVGARRASGGGLVIGRPGATSPRAAGWLCYGGYCGGGRVVGMKGFACGSSLFCIVDVGRSALAILAARCDTGGVQVWWWRSRWLLNLRPGDVQRVVACPCDVMAAAPCLGWHASSVSDSDGGSGLSLL